MIQCFEMLIDIQCFSLLVNHFQLILHFSIITCTYDKLCHIQKSKWTRVLFDNHLQIVQSFCHPQNYFLPRLNNYYLFRIHCQQFSEITVAYSKLQRYITTKFPRQSSIICISHLWCCLQRKIWSNCTTVHMHALFILSLRLMSHNSRLFHK